MKRNAKAGSIVWIALAFVTALLICECLLTQTDRRKLAGLQASQAAADAQIQAVRDRTAGHPALRTAAPVEAPAFSIPEGRLQSDLGIDALTDKRMRLWLNLHYASFFQKIGLSPEKAAKFESLVMQFEAMKHDAIEAAVANKLSPSDPLLQNLLAQELAPNQAQMKQLLGPQDYSELEQFTQTSVARYWTSGLAGQLYDSEPLTSQQSDSLLQVIAKAQIAQDPAAGGPAIDWPTALQNAQSILSPRQYSTLAALVNGNTALTRLTARVQGAQNGSSPAN